MQHGKRLYFSVSASRSSPFTDPLVIPMWQKPSKHIHLNPWLLISLQVLLLALVLVTTILGDHALKSAHKNLLMNDGIPTHLCSLTYVMVDDTITQILEGQIPFLQRSILSMHFACFQCILLIDALLTMEWKQSIYIDTYLPFGLRSAPKLFNILSGVTT